MFRLDETAPLRIDGSYHSKWYLYDKKEQTFEVRI